jgi:DNA relaxase NicK
VSIPVPPKKGAASQALHDEFDILLKSNLSNYVHSDISERLRAIAEAANPPSNNMGGHYQTPPPFLPQCEKQPVKLVNKTKIDWLAASSPKGHEALRLLLAVIWPAVTFSRNSHGMPGYPCSDAIIVDGAQYGQLGYGASHGRDFFAITGTGCRTLDDELIEVFYEALAAVDGTLSRIDICLDCYNGERTLDHALWARSNGAFKRPNGTEPDWKVVTSNKGDDTNLGRTLYVGRRGGEVMARIYEKGLEVFAKMPEEFRLASEAREIVSGKKPDFADDWVRLELEFRKQGKDRPLPLQMLLERDKYFAGAYPYCADALGVADGIRPVSVVHEDNVDFIKMTNAGRRSYGNLFFTMKECGFSDTEIVQMFIGNGNNEKLVRSGLFAKMKQAADAARSSDPDFDVPF